MPKRILRVKLANGADGSLLSHIVEVEFTDDGTINAVPTREPREAVAVRIRAGQEFYTIGKDGKRAEVEAFPLHNIWYLRTKSDNSKPDNLLSLDTY